MKSGAGATWRAQSVLHENIINIHNYSCPKRSHAHACGGASHVAIETNGGILINRLLYVVKLSHAATTTGYYTLHIFFASVYKPIHSV